MEENIGIPMHYVNGNIVYPGEENEPIVGTIRLGGTGDPGYIYINFLVGDKEIGIDESNITIHDKNINAWFSEDSKGKKALAMDTYAYSHNQIFETILFLLCNHDPIVIPLILTVIDKSK